MCKKNICLPGSFSTFSVWLVLQIANCVHIRINVTFKDMFIYFIIRVWSGSLLYTLINKIIWNDFCTVGAVKFLIISHICYRRCDLMSLWCPPAFIYNNRLKISKQGCDNQSNSLKICSQLVLLLFNTINLIALFCSLKFLSASGHHPMQVLHNLSMN